MWFWLCAALLAYLVLRRAREHFLALSTRSTRNMSYDLRGDPVRRRNPLLRGCPKV